MDFQPLETPDEAETADPITVLRTVFGLPGFRGQQAEVVAHVIAGGDAIVLMPTGGGKSLCYQLPALCRPGVGIVVSPLIALMRDQVAAMRQLGRERRGAEFQPHRRRSAPPSARICAPGGWTCSTSRPNG